jgi:hypothetical protein
MSDNDSDSDYDSDSDHDKEQAILDQAEKIKLKRFNEEQAIVENKRDIIKRSWYDTVLNGWKNKLGKCDEKLENVDKTVNTYRKEYIASIASERQEIEKEIQSLGNYTGQCLHQGGRSSRWITDRYDSHGYQMTSCSMCGGDVKY